MTVRPCSACGSTAVQEGFLNELAKGVDGGAVRWILGPLERSFLGNAKVGGRKRFDISAWRCEECHHLDLYADGPPG